MRRKEKEITDESGVLAVIRGATVCRLGLVDGDTAYIVPLCFGYRDNTLFFHSALKGRKIDLIQQNPKVCVEFDSALSISEEEQACDWGMKYQSVIGFGTATFVEDSEEKRKALDVIMAQYSNRQFEFPDNMVSATAIIRVDIEEMTGKQSGF